ncbi:hypothetical protein N7468_009321, partial [Penicillium chermesinum]
NAIYTRMAYQEMRNRVAPSSHHDPLRGPAIRNRDDVQLQRLGKRPSLKRNFGMLSLVGFSCLILLTWEGIVVVGPAGVMYAYFFAWTGTACCFLVLGELASMAPTSGGQYHWCAMLAPMHCMKFLSYVTGWLTVIGWQVANAATNHLCAVLIQNIIQFNHQSYSPDAWKRVMICWGVQLLSLGTNLIGGKFLPRLETLALVIHVLGFFGIMIPLAYMSEHRTSQQVFQDFWNSGGFSMQSLSWFVGSIGCAGAFAGGDGAVHMAEEVENAAVALPRALLITLIINGFLGVGMMVVLLYCMDNIELALKASTGYSAVEFFYRATGSKSGAISLPRRLPTYAIYLAVTVSVLISLIDIGSEIAHTVMISIAIPGWYSSYLIVELLLLYHRCRGQIALQVDYDDTKINTPGEKLVWGPFRVPGIWGILVNGYAIVYSVLVIFFSFWPAEMRPTATGMNYSVVSTGGTVILAIVYYVCKARHVYRGPIMETSMYD